MSLLQGFTQAIHIDLQGSSNLGSTVGSATAELDRFATSAKRMGVLGGILTGVGAAMTGFATLAAASTIRTQEALGEMASLGYQDLGLLENAAADFSDRFAGTSKAEYIKAAYDIKSGIASLSDAGVADFTRLSALTARATRSTVSEMTSLFATAYGIYKGFYSDLSDSQFGELFSGGLAAAVQQFKTTGPGMAAAISRLGAAATTAMVPMEEQLSVLGMLQATMSGEEAGTKYKQFMLNTARAGQQLGLSFTDARGQLLPMADVLDALKQKFGQTIDAAEKLQIQQAFGTVEALAVVDLLIGKTDDLRSNIDALSTAMAGGSSITLEMAEAMDRGLGPVLALTKQRLSNALEELGKPMAELIGPALDILSGMVETFRAWASTHPGLIKVAMGVTLIGGGIITLAGSLLLAAAGFGTLAEGVIGAAAAMGIGTASSLTMTGAVAGLGTAIWSALAPILPIVGAAAAVAGLLYLAWKSNFLGIRDAVSVAVANIKVAFGFLMKPLQMLWNMVKQGFGGWIDSVRAWYDSWNSSLTGAASPLVQLVNVVSYGIGYVYGLLAHFLEWMQPAVVTAFQVVKQVFGTSWDAIAGTFRIGLALMQGDWSGAWDAMKQTAVALFNDLRGLLDLFTPYFEAIWAKIGDSVISAFDAVWTTLKTGFFGLLNFFVDGINQTTSLLNLLPSVNIPTLESFSPTDSGEFSAGAGNVVSNAFSSVRQGNRSVQVDRSISGVTLNLNTPAGADTKSIRDALIQALEELAGQSDGIEEAVYAQ